ncbi:hypothetical protein WMY93_001051 [Mugilogobius chulae]|uniref:B30.2/SPRY domain-containing protein n=1 Tax=Mugilogobius chulae TaxID=88201 RepID=A0AAW0Q250_9GOBI
MARLYWDCNARDQGSPASSRTLPWFGEPGPESGFGTSSLRRMSRLHFRGFLDFSLTARTFDSCEYSLDPNTAHRKLKLSEDRRTVTFVCKEQQYPDHEDRFTDWPQVLSCTGLRGRCYWEVDWSGELVDIAVSYRGIRRRGETEECWFGGNDQSWSLRIFGGDYHFYHNNRHTNLSSSSSLPSGRVSVLLDSEAGSLSFYDVGSDGKLSHLHTSGCSFTEPLFLGFRLWREDDSVSVVDLRRASPAEPL